MRVLGIDPGQQGGLVMLNSEKGFGNDWAFYVMPILKNKDVDFNAVFNIIQDTMPDHIFLEKSVSFGMGSKGAFNYGRGFAVLEIAIQLSGTPMTYVEPARWTKVMCEGIDKRFRAKERSLKALKKHFPTLSKDIPTNKNGKIHEGIMDALLIAAFGMNIKTQSISKEDF